MTTNSRQKNKNLPATS